MGKRTDRIAFEFSRDRKIVNVRHLAKVVEREPFVDFGFVECAERV